MAKKPAKKQRRSRPIYFEVVEVADLRTGEHRLALLALTRWDRRAMQDRKYRAGDQVRAELKAPRNVKFHRLAHALGALLVQHVPGFESLDAHSALKRVQIESGVHCVDEEFDLPGLGRISRRVPASMSFDEMDEGAFNETWAGIVAHVKLKYWPELEPDAVEEMAELTEGRA